MLQNPHRQRCDALRKGQRARASPGAACFPMTPPPNGGNCAVRGARSSSAYVEGTTKRGELHHEMRAIELGLRRGHHQTGGIAPIEPRHAGRMLLMVQNPHHYPWCHAPPLVQCTLTGAALPGGVPINAGKASPTETGQGHGRTVPRRRLWPMRRNTRSG